MFPTLSLGVGKQAGRKSAWTSNGRRPALPPELPGRAIASNHRCHRLPRPMLDHRLPRHQAESHAAIEHCESSARELHAAAVDTADALVIGHSAVARPVFEAMALAAASMSRLRNVANRLRAKIRRCPRRSASPCSIRKSARCRNTARTSPPKPCSPTPCRRRSTAGQPGRADHARLPLNGQVRTQFH